MSRRPLFNYLLAALLMLAGLLAPLLLVHAKLSFVTSSLLTGVLEILLFGLPALLILRAQFVPRAYLRAAFMKPTPYFSGLTMLSAVSFVLAGALLGAVFYTLLDAFGLRVDLPDVITPASPLDLAAAALTIGLVTAVCEELFFRGALMALLTKKLSRRVAVLISSALFALLHFNLIGLPTLFVFALLMHRLQERRGGLFLPVLFHGMYNVSILVMNYAGGAPGFAAILLSAGIFAFCARALLKPEPQGTDRLA